MVNSQPIAKIENEFAQIYRKNVQSIFRFIYLRTNSKEIAEDLTSNVFLRYWRFINSETSLVNNPRAFLYQSARHLLVDFYRRKKSEPIKIHPDDQDNFESGERFKIIDPIEKIELDEKTKKIQRALTKIKPEYQEILIWKYLDEIKTKEIAEILNKSEGTVRVMISRALKELRKSYEALN